MNTTVFHRRRAERFAQLVDEASGGRRHHVRSRLDEQLAELVAIGHQVSALTPAADLDPEFRTGLRAMLVATAEREGIGRTARPTADSELAPAHRAPVRRPASRRAPAGRRASTIRPIGTPGRIRTRGAIVVGVAVGAIAVSGMSAASENAVPGDALYGVKRSTERAQLAFASSDVTRGQLYLDFARKRVAEAAAVRKTDGYADVLTDMDADTRQGVRLLTTAATHRRDPAALEVVDVFVTNQRRALNGLLDHLDEPQQARTEKSLALLDSVAKRVAALQATLTCGTSPTEGTDQLGPKPRDCTAGVTPRTTVGEPQGEGQPGAGEGPADPRTENTDPTVPGADPDAPAGTGPSAPAAVSTDPADAVPAEDDGMLSDIGRVFGGLLD